MAEVKKKPAATVLQNMDKPGFAKVLRHLDEVHEASDEASIGVAGEYKKFKKQGVNLDALRLVRKLHALGSLAKVQAFLVDFDRMRELASFDDQLALFSDDKTAVQKKVEETAKGAEGNVVQHPASAKAAKAEKPAKKTKRVKGAIPAPEGVAPAPASQVLPSKIPEAAESPTKAKLFAEGDDDDSDVEEIGELEKARADGLARGAAGESYDNPFKQPGESRDAWHAGWVEGAERFEQAESAAQKSA